MVCSIYINIKQKKKGEKMGRISLSDQIVEESGFLAKVLESLFNIFHNVEMGDKEGTLWSLREIKELIHNDADSSRIEKLQIVFKAISNSRVDIGHKKTKEILNMI